MHNTTKMHYLNCGYKIPMTKDEAKDKILVKVEDLTNGSKVYVTKVCDICKEKVKNQGYGSIIKRRNKNKTELDYCAVCSKAVGGRTRADKIPIENSIIYLSPCVFNEWDKAKNIKPPEKVSLNSHKKYWWICSDCNSSYDMSPDKRKNQNSKCPYCSGKRVNDTNSLQTIFPELIDEWNFIENKNLSPNTVHKGSHKKVWWICNNGHQSYYMEVRLRTSRDRGCPNCSTSISKGEERIAKFLRMKNISYTKEYTFDDCRNMRCLPFDFFIHSDKRNSVLLIEYDGEQHFRGWNLKNDERTKNSLSRIKKHDKIKNDYCIENDIKLIRIPYWEYENIEKILDRVLFILSNVESLSSEESDEYTYQFLVS